MLGALFVTQTLLADSETGHAGVPACQAGVGSVIRKTEVVQKSRHESSRLARSVSGFSINHVQVEKAESVQSEDSAGESFTRCFERLCGQGAGRAKAGTSRSAGDSRKSVEPIQGTRNFGLVGPCWPSVRRFGGPSSIAPDLRSDAPNSSVSDSCSPNSGRGVPSCVRRAAEAVCLAARAHASGGAQGGRRAKAVDRSPAWGGPGRPAPCAGRRRWPAVPTVAARPRERFSDGSGDASGAAELASVATAAQSAPENPASTSGRWLRTTEWCRTDPLSVHRLAMLAGVSHRGRGIAWCAVRLVSLGTVATKGGCVAVPNLATRSSSGGRAYAAGFRSGRERARCAVPIRLGKRSGASCHCAGNNRCVETIGADRRDYSDFWRAGCNCRSCTVAWAQFSNMYPAEVFDVSCPAQEIKSLSVVYAHFDLCIVLNAPNSCVSASGFAARKLIRSAKVDCCSSQNRQSRCAAIVLARFTGGAICLALKLLGFSARHCDGQKHIRRGEVLDTSCPLSATSVFRRDRSERAERAVKVFIFCELSGSVASENFPSKRIQKTEVFGISSPGVAREFVRRSACNALGATSALAVNSGECLTEINVQKLPDFSKVISRKNSSELITGINAGASIDPVVLRFLESLRGVIPRSSSAIARIYALAGVGTRIEFPFEQIRLADSFARAFPVLDEATMARAPP